MTLSFKIYIIFNFLTDDSNGFGTLKKPFLVDYPQMTHHVSGTNEIIWLWFLNKFYLEDHIINSHVIKSLVLTFCKESYQKNTTEPKACTETHTHMKHAHMHAHVQIHTRTHRCVHPHIPFLVLIYKLKATITSVQ